MDFKKPIAKIQDFQAIKLKLASPEIIKSWSYGEVDKPETINYRTQKPEKGGLFAEEIFGPSKDWECYCGKYKKIRHKGMHCDKCGVEVTVALVRRERMGHIALATPVSHIWFLRGVPSKISLALDVSVQSLEKVIYFASFIITSVDENLKKATIEQVKEELKQKSRQLEGTYKKEMERLGKDAEGDAQKQKHLADSLEKLQEALNSKISTLEHDFDLTMAEIKQITPLSVISENDYQELSLRYGHIFTASIGAEAIYDLLKKVDISKEIEKIEAELPEAQGGKKLRFVRRIKLLRSLKVNKIKPDWMILTIIPVIPPDLRPMVALDGGRFATSDWNDLYRRVINRNNRLKRLHELNAPEVISRNEKRMLQEAVDSLIDNSARHSKTVVAATGKKRQLKSIADILKGKQGRFRQNLLGKRIDYSGRSVIVVGPELKLHQCGLPKRMALELFRPFIISQLIKREVVHNIRSANKFIATGDAQVWDILEEVTRESLVLLNRAPTLHRLGIQAFQPILIEGKAIQIHPLVCTAFNADFDGDQMAVHVPLTEEAKKEAREMMLASRNLLKPATGDPIARPEKDIAWGCYFMTVMDETPEGDRVMVFGDPSEAKLAYQMGKIKLQTKIKVRMKFGRKTEIIETNVGRILVNEVLPTKMPFVNEVMDKKKLDELLKHLLDNFGIPETAVLLDNIKAIGFHYITKSGYSWGMADLPEVGKEKLIAQGNAQVEEVESQYNEGLLTQNERHLKIIEIWTKIKDEVSTLSKKTLDPRGPVASMINAGARGSWGQLTQMMGMKGLLANPSGEIMELPVKKSFKEGLSVLEYFISTHGSRKGLADTALRTANAGYLTRRLVDVAQDVVVREEDCGDDEGVILTIAQSEEIGETIWKRAFGRVLLSDIKNPKTGRAILKAGEIIDAKTMAEIEKLGIDNVHVRSIMKCRLRRGICAKCYGFDLAYSELIKIGSAVGIIAAQSIGEPGTQLTMRTLHSGGVAGKDITQGLPRVEELFEARPPKQRAFIAEVAGQVSVSTASREVISEEGETLVAARSGQKLVKINYLSNESESYKFTKKDTVKAKEGDSIGEGDIIILKASGDEVHSKTEGIVSFDGSKLVVTRQADKSTEYIIPSNYQIIVKDGDFVEIGDAITDGNLDLQLLYKYKGRGAVEKYILKEIKHIYFSQGQKLNDKHIEIIIRQMFSRVLISDSGDTPLLPGEVIERAEFEEENSRVKKEKGKEATGDDLFLGITRVSLSTQSFLSAASFQETARVLINAAITGKVDKLHGLKENVIIGRLIPAGTGFKAKEAK